MTTSTASQILFIDSRVTNADSLLAGIDSNIEIVWLSADRDGLEQIAGALAGRSGVSAVHVVSHGGAGYLSLGAGIVDIAGLASHTAQLDTIRAALADTADFLLYGCNVADGDAGTAFLDALAGATGADVAASTDATGSALLGGDATLEQSTGPIESAVLDVTTLEGTLALPGAHSAASGGEVFLGGNYIELGISSVGSFGTTGSKPGGFFGTSGSSQLGMSNDADGFGAGKNVAIDYFLPGSPEERWAVGYNSNQTASASALNGNTGTISGTSLTNTSSGDTLSATFKATANGSLKVQQIISFGVNDKFFKNTVTLTNSTGSAMTDVRFMRSFDPDNTVFVDGGSGYTTTNKVESTIAADGKAVVSATSGAGSYSSQTGSTAKILFFSKFAGAVGAAFGFANTNPYDAAFSSGAAAKGYSVTVDGGLSMVFKVGNLAAGASATFEYFTSLDTADIATTVAAIEEAAVPNRAPTFSAATQLAGTVTDTGADDVFATISGTLSATDTDGGTLSYSGSATGAYGRLTVGSNGAYSFVPDKAAIQPLTGSVNQDFTVTVSDGQGGSATQTLRFVIAGGNDAPVITDTSGSSMAAQLPAIDEDAAINNGATVSSLFGARFTDRDSSASLGGVVVEANAATGGQWQYCTDGSNWHDIGSVSTSNALALSAATRLRFNPDLNWNGTPTPLTVRVTDNLYAGGYTSGAEKNYEASLSASGVSSNSVQVSVTVEAVNDAPGFVDGEGNPVTQLGAQLGDTAALDTAGSLTLAVPGSLSGTVRAVDPEGSSPITYSLRGGSLVDSTWTMQGLYGVLTLNATTHAWVYTPNKLDLINALPIDAVVHDTFAFKVADPSGAASTLPLDITITGTNDLPRVSAIIANQSFDGSGSWSFQVPAGALTDAEGNGLTYTAKLADGSDLPGWLTFDGATRSFSGNPPAGLADLSLEVTATDSEDESISTTFTLDLTGERGLNDRPTGGVTITNTTDGPRGTTTLQQGDVLQAANTLADADGPASPTVSYQWYANGVAIAGATGGTLTLGQAQVGKVITVVARYTDAGSVVESVSSAATQAVVNVNDVPSLTPGLKGTLADGVEDRATVVGRADLLKGWSDADGDSLTISGLTVTNPASGTRVDVNGDGSYAITVPEDYNGLVTLSYTVTDTKSSPLAATHSFTVVPVNDPATATELSQIVDYTEDASSVALGDIVVSDVEGDTVTAVLTLNTPAAGVLTTFGTAIYNAVTGVWSISGSIADVNAALAAVSFTPAANWDTNVTITTLIRDARGAGPAVGTITLNVTGGNDAPTSTLDSISTVVGSDNILALTDFGTFADLDSGAAQTPASIKFTQLPSVGSLKYTINGTDWLDVGLDQAISAAEINAGHLKYVPATETGTEVAAAVVAAFGGTGSTLYNAAIKEGATNTVVLTAKASGALTNIASGTLAGGSYTATVTREGAALTAEQTDVTFSAPAGATSLRFDGLTIDISESTTAADVAAKVAGDVNSSSANWTATVTDDVVHFTAKAPGVRTDLQSSDFVGSVPVSLASAVQVLLQGSDGPMVFPEIVNITFGALSVPEGQVTVFTFDGHTLTLIGPKTAEQVAQAFYDAQTESPDAGAWHVTGPGPLWDQPTVVQLQANTEGDQTDLTTADFVASVAYPTTITSIQQGAAATTEQVELTFTGSYSGATVTIDGVTATAGTAGGAGFDSLKFQVGDGTDFSSSAYILSINGPDNAVTLATSALTTTADSVWTDVYASAPINGFGESTVRVVVEVIAGHLKLSDLTAAGAVIEIGGSGHLTDGSATRLVFEGTQAQVNAALDSLEINRGTSPEATLTISAVDTTDPTALVSRSFTVTAPAATNAAPTANELLTQTVTYTEGAEPVALGDIVVADSDVGDTITATLLLSAPAAGALTTSGSASYDATTGVWSISGSVADVNAALAALSFVPASGWDTDVTITTLIRDAAGTGPAPGTITLDVTAVNTAPTSTDDAVSTPFDTPLVLSLADFGNYSDPENGEEHYIIVTSLPTNGTLTLAGVGDITIGMMDNASGLPGTSALPEGEKGYWISVEDIVAGKLTFTPTTGFSGDTAISFRVEENPISGYNYSTTILVGGSNTPPSGTANAALPAGTEDNAYTVTAAQLTQGITDSDGGTLQVVNLSADHGSVLKSGDSYTITPDANYNGLVRLSYNVIDGQGGVIAATQQFTLNPVDDPLTLTAPMDDRIATAGSAINLYFDKPFRDVDTGDTITYEATANGQALSVYNLTFSQNDTQLIISGNPVGTPAINFVITGTSSGDGDVLERTTSFTLNLQAAAGEGTGEYGLSANNLGVVTISGTAAELQTLTAQRPTDLDGLSASTVVTYQWQVSADGSTGWTDVSGGRGLASTTATTTTFALTQEEVGKFVRVQAFYTDAGGVAESPASSATATAVSNVNQLGALTIDGSASAIGNVLTATLTDPDGLTKLGSTVGEVSYPVSYQWHRLALPGDVPSGGTAIAGATSSSYTVAEGDAGKYLTVVAVYKDDWQTTATLTATSPTSQVGQAQVAPVALNDAASLTETAGTVVTPASISDNVVDNDTDDNSPDTKTVVDVRFFAVDDELGAAATHSGSTFTSHGTYGTLVLHEDGSYTYTLDEAHREVDALRAGGFLTETFHYTVADSAGLSDTASLVITIDGANDQPTVTGIASAVTVLEDVAYALPLNTLNLVDPDGPSLSLRLSVEHGSLRAVSTDPGVTITGSDTGTLTISASTAIALEGWITSNSVYYVGAPNANGAPADSLQYALSDGAGFTTATGTTAITVTPVNDAPIVDVGGSGSAGNNGEATFRPRGEAVLVAPSLTLADVESNSLSSATVTLASGAKDNEFGFLYESLSLSSAGAALAAAAHLSVVATQSSAGAVLTLTGAGSLADYQAVLREVLYNNTNQNAFAADRSVTFSVTDGLASNTASFATALANTDIAVGQRIFVNGVDSGYLVAQVVDGSHFVASAPLTGLAAGAALSFRDTTGEVTTATVQGPLVATTTVHVPWTPVVDMNGSDPGHDRSIAYVEGQGALAVATANATITDQGGLIRQVTVTLVNPLDNGSVIHETLIKPSPTISAWLASWGITYTGNGSDADGLTDATQLVFTASGAGADATNFQVALRAVTYQNTSENPDTRPRELRVTSVDVDGNTGVSASTYINPIKVNDAPAGTDGAITGTEDVSYVLSAAEFGFTDPTDDADGAPDALAAVKITTLPTAGSLYLNGAEVTPGQVVTVADINAGHLTYSPVQDAAGNAVATLTFQVQDNGGKAYEGDNLDPIANTLTINLTPVNDAPVLTADGADLTGITEDDDTDANAGDLVSTLLGTITDTDSGTHAANNGTLTGMAVYAVASPAIGGTWEYKIGGGDWTSFNFTGANAGKAVLLADTDSVRFKPDTVGGTSADGLTQPSLSYYAWDQSAGTAGSYVSVDSRGVGTTLSIVGDTVEIAVADVNDAPSINGLRVVEVSFPAASAGTTLYGFDGISADVGGLDAAGVAAAFAAACNASGASHWTATVNPLDATKVYFTAKTASSGSIGASDFTLHVDAGVPVGTATYGPAPTTFGHIGFAPLASGGVIEFDGVSATIPAGSTGADVARAIFAAVKAANPGSYRDLGGGNEMAYTAHQQVYQGPGYSGYIGLNYLMFGTLSGPLISTDMFSVYEVSPVVGLSAATLPSTGTTIAGVADALFLVNVAEDAATVVSGLSLDDLDISGRVDANLTNDVLTVTLSVAHGQIHVGSPVGVTVGDDDSPVVTLTGSLADLNTALGSLGYIPSPHFNGVDSLTVTVDDQGNVGSDGALQTTARVALVVAASNDAPVLTANGRDLTGITEDDDTDANAGDLVSTLLGTITDADSGTHAANNGTLTGMAVYAVASPAIGGTWQYKVGGGDWTSFDFSGPNAGKAVLLASTDSVRFVPDSVGGTSADGLTQPSLSYYAWDQSAGTAGSYVSIDDRGAGTALSIVGDTVEIAVADVNDAPSMAWPVARTVVEEGTIPIAGISFGDVDITGRSDGNTGNDSVSLSLSVSHGVLQLADLTGLRVDAGVNGSSASLTVSGSLAAVNAAMLGLRYTADLDYVGSDSLSVTLSDLGNVGSGGARTVTGSVAITVTGVNDAPVLTAAAPSFSTITEDDTANAGSLVSELVNGLGQTGVADADGLVADGTEGIGQGIAVFAASQSGLGGGTWQYNLNEGAGWQAVSLSADHGLLLRSTDKIRFLPDEENATSASISYYLWDGATGTAGTLADVSEPNRGGTSAFSLTSDVASISVTPVNDLPTLGTGGGAVFSIRGDAVPLFDASTLDIGDVDAGEHLTSAVLTIDSDAAIDNAFGTLYETLFSTAGGSFSAPSGAVISITGNGTEDSPLTLSGVGTVEDYKAALLTLRYENTNVYASAADRPVSVTLYDEATSTAGSGAGSVVSALTVSVVWGPVVDLNGEALAGRDYFTDFTENASGIAVMASDASITDQDGNIASVTVSLTNHPDGAYERLYVDPAQVAAILGLGITIDNSDPHVVVLTAPPGGKDGTYFQLAMRAIRYENTSEDPDSTDRTVSIESLDVDGYTGVSATTTIGVTPVNDAPTLAALTGGAATEVALSSGLGSVSGLSGTAVGADVDSANPGNPDGIAYDIVGGSPGLGDDAGLVVMEGRYGTFKIDPVSGAYTYVPDAAEINRVAQGATATDSFTVLVTDVEGLTETQNYVVTLTGANDAPVVTVSAASRISEAADASAQDLSLSGTVDYDTIDSGDLIDIAAAYNSDIVWSGGSLNPAQIAALTIGTFAASATDVTTGSTGWTYAANDIALDFLGAGETITFSFTVTATDSHGATGSGVVSITIEGSNDAPTLSASSPSMLLIEAGGPGNAIPGVASATVALTAADLDGTTPLYDGVWLVSEGWTDNTGGIFTKAGTYGSATLDTSTGVVSYLLNDSAAATEALAAGPLASDDFVIQVTDGSATGQTTARFMIFGSNDAAAISVSGFADTLVLEAGGAANTNPGDASASGRLVVSDVDAGEDRFQPVGAGSLVGTYGDFAFDPNTGVWSYLLDQTKANSLPAVALATDTLTVRSADGSAIHTITVDIIGANDDATISVASADVTVTEQGGVANDIPGDSSAGGTLAISDADTGENHFIAPTPDDLAGIYGDFTFNALTGEWAYTLDDAKADTLAGADSATDRLTVSSADGSASRTIEVAINGRNDVATVGNASVSRTEGDTAAAISASGTVSIADVDSGETRTVVQAASAGLYGTFAVDADGNWTYTASSAHDELDAGQVVADSFNVVSFDGSATGTVSIQITGSNDRPTAIGVDNLSVVENTSTSGGLKVATLSTTDVDHSDRFTYSIVNGDDSFYFYVVGNELFFQSGVGLNAETKNTYNLTLRSTDSGNLTVDRAIQVSVTDVDEFDVTAPNFDVQLMAGQSSPNTVAEDSLVNAFTGITAVSTDADLTRNNVSYSLVGSASGGAYTAGEFSIDSLTGRISVAGTIDREVGATRTLYVKATSLDGSSGISNLTINVADVDEFDVTTPTDGDGTANSVVENAANGMQVGITAGATDGDATTNTVSYSLVNSDGTAYVGGEFAIGASSGIVTVAGSIDRELGATRTLYVKATSLDGSSAQQSFTVNVTDVDEFDVGAVSDSDAAANAIDENVAVGTAVGITAAATDGDATSSAITYSLSSNVDGLFAIDAGTGVVTTAKAIDRESVGASRTIEVTATSADGSTSVQSFTIAVGDLNDNAPLFTSGASGSVAENAATSTVIYTAQATDADATAANNTVSYALKDGGDKALLDIDTTTGVVTLKASANFETKAAYSFTVLASDGTNVTERAVTVNVGNVDEAAVGTLTVSGVAAQGGVLTASLSATDVDGAITSVAYQWQERVSGSWEDIPGDTGATLEPGNDQDVVGRVGRVVVTTTDALGGTTVFRSGAVTIANVNDAPTGQPAIAGTVTQGQTLTASAGTLVDPDGLGVISYQWLADGAAIGGATGTTLVLGEAQVGKEISVLASYTDGFGQAESVTGSRTAAVRNVNDAPAGSVSIIGTPVQNATLTVASTLADADGLGTVTYKWMSGATQLGTGSSYTLGADDVGRSIHVVASWTDGHGSAESVSSAATSAVANVNDVPTGSLGISGSAEEGQTLSAVSTLADADGMGTLAYQWLADGVAISGATGSSFMLTPGQVGKAITVQARWVDGQGSTEQLTSSATGKVNAVSTAGEGDAPSIAGGTAGDGNGDGVADAIQSAVASSAVSVTTGGTTTSSYVTLVADSAAGKVADGSTNTVTSFNQTVTAGYMPTNSDTPLGSLNFSASTDTVSGLETFSLYVDKDLGINGYWVTNSEGTLVNLASEAYGGRMVVDGDKLRLDFQVADGSALDHDGSADGSIQLNGAVGYVPLSLIAYTPDAPVNQANAPIWD